MYVCMYVYICCSLPRHNVPVNPHLLYSTTDNTVVVVYNIKPNVGMYILNNRWSMQQTAKVL